VRCLTEEQMLAWLDGSVPPNRVTSARRREVSGHAPARCRRDVVWRGYCRRNTMYQESAPAPGGVVKDKCVSAPAASAKRR